MSPRAILPTAPLALLALLLTSCGSTPVAELSVRSSPPGATVHLQRIGERDWEGKLGPIEGDVKSEDYSDAFVYIGETPLEHDVDLEEKESGGTILGVGGRVMLEFDEALLRIEKEGFLPLERRVRLEDGEQAFSFRLSPVEPAAE